jgi:hypothetical protein
LNLAAINEIDTEEAHEMMQGVWTILNRTEVWLGMLAVAAFLVLIWALRGAPLGQAASAPDEHEDAPGAGYRDRVVLAMVGGMFLVLSGAQLALSGRLLWSLPAFGLGFGIVLTLIAVNHRYRHSSPSLRRTIELANTFLGVALVAGILVVINVMAFRFGGRALDLTREGTYTLSSLTLNQLKSLKRPVRMTVFQGDSLRARSQVIRVQQLLDLYKAANPEHVSIASMNPYTELERYEALVKRYPDIGVSQGGGILIEYADGEDPATGHVVIRNSDLFELPRGARFDATTVRFTSSFRGEDALTTALIRLEEGKRTRIALVVGHGEPSTGELDPRKEGLGVFKSRLGALGYEVVELNLLREPVPADVELVAVVGPKAPFSADEAAKLKAATDAGKPLLAVVGGPGSPDERSGLEELFRSFNLAIEPSVAVDPRFNFQGRPVVVYVPILAQLHHPIVDSLVNRAVLMPRASPIKILTAATESQAGRTYNQGFLPAEILRTSETAWGETDLSGKALRRDEKEERGPLRVGAAVSERPRPESGPQPKPRLVLFASRFMADNLFLVEEPTNLDLLMNAINWLRGEAYKGGIGPKSHVALTLAADPLLRTRLVLVPTVMSVLLIIGLGVTTYMARRE